MRLTTTGNYTIIIGKLYTDCAIRTHSRRCSQTVRHISACLFVGSIFVFSIYQSSPPKKTSQCVERQSFIVARHQKWGLFDPLWLILPVSRRKSKGDISIATVARGQLLRGRDVRAVWRLLKYLRISVDYLHRRKPCTTLGWAHISTPVGPICNPWMVSIWNFCTE